MMKELSGENKEILRKEIFGSKFYKMNSVSNFFKIIRNNDPYEKVINQHDKNVFLFFINVFTSLFSFMIAASYLDGNPNTSVFEFCVAIVLFPTGVINGYLTMRKLTKMSIEYLDHCKDMVSRPHRKEVSYNSLVILANHYPEFYIKEKFANKGLEKLSYYDLLDEKLFEEIFKFKRNKPGKNDNLFLETLEKLKEEKIIK